MILFLKEYHGQPRLLRVIRDGEVFYDKEGASFDTMTVSEDKLCFQPDSETYILDLEQIKKVSALHTGDIVTIDEWGVIRRVFDIASDDACIFMNGFCNSNCVMCPSTDRERQRDGGFPEPVMLQYIDMLPEETSHVVITGGEPTMKSGLFFRVLERLSERFSRAEVLLLTNGRSFASVKMSDHLANCAPSFLKTAIPIHGDTAQLHDSITRAPGSFKQTCLGIRHLLRRGMNIEIRVVVTKLNCRYLTGIARLISEQFRDVGVVNFIGLEVRGNCAKNYQNVYISHQEAFHFIKEAAQILIASGIDVSLYNFPLCSVEKGWWPLCRKSISPEKVRFADGCASCDAVPYCGGFFNTTLKKAKPTVYPIMIEELSSQGDGSIC